MQIFTILPMGTHTIHHYGTMYGTNNIVPAKTNLIKYYTMANLFFLSHDTIRDRKMAQLSRRSFQKLAPDKTYEKLQAFAYFI